MKNKFVDLNNHLFEQLERLNDADLKGKALQEEISRARAMADVSGKIIEAGKTVILAARVRQEGLDKSDPLDALTAPTHPALDHKAG